mgnify:CR=1 FL=1
MDRSGPLSPTTLGHTMGSFISESTVAMARGRNFRHKKTDIKVGCILIFSYFSNRWYQRADSNRHAREGGGF